MLIPQFSLRWLLAITALCAGVSFVLSYALRGETWILGVSAPQQGSGPPVEGAVWAIGTTAALGSIVMLAVLYVGAFLAAWLIASVGAALFPRPPAGQSPFANKTLDDTPFNVPSGIAESTMAESPPPISG